MKYLLSCLLILIGPLANACTVCGCSASNQSLGILPEFHKNFVGLQFQSRNFTSTHLSHEATGPTTTSQEKYRSLQLWGRYNIGSRVQVFAFVPYDINASFHPGDVKRISGLGDITLLGNVQIFPKEALGEKLKHNLQVGGGLKLPTGAYDATSTMTEDGLPNMQPGTKSWDVLANANYTLRGNRIGGNIDAAFTYTTANYQQYKYGNRLSSALTMFYWHQDKNFTILPQLGLRFEHSGTDYDNYKYKWKNDMSGGDQLYATVGLQAFHKRVGAQVTAYKPVYQHFASGRVHADFKLDAGLLFFL